MLIKKNRLSCETASFFVVSCHSSESQRYFLIIVWIPAECPVLKNLTEE